MSTDVEDLNTILERAIAAAECQMRDELGSATACQIHKDGRVTGGLKYAEGRLVVLNDLRRQLRSSAVNSLEEISAALKAELARWRGNLVAQRARKQPAMPWLAYAQGGVDALEELEADLTSDAQVGRAAHTQGENGRLYHPDAGNSTPVP